MYNKQEEELIMEEFIKNKNYKVLMWIFIIISIVHVIYATITMRGMYEDGAFYMIDQLNSYSNGIFKISSDYSHPRFCIMALLELPSIFSFYILSIHNKYALMMIFSCYFGIINSPKELKGLIFSIGLYLHIR